jgi:hypothetical protein
MVGAAVGVVRIDLGIDWVGNIAGDVRDQFAVCQSNRTCGLRRPSARHQLANGRSNTVSRHRPHLFLAWSAWSLRSNAEVAAGALFSAGYVSAF